MSPWDSFTQIATAWARADSGISESISGAFSGAFERSTQTQA
jgi:hypothetical protein